jgi:3-hydroxyacyl-[acyl-carrier-protein] dehydratase
MADIEKRASENPYRLSIDQIQRFLPHRAPFLLVDRVLEIHPTSDVKNPDPAARVGVKVVALKNVSYNEPFFPGHFPGFPLMPGVLIVEALAQTASFSLYPYIAHDLDRLARGFQCILVGVDGARFRKPVVPGDTLRLETTVTKCRGKLWAFDGKAYVDGQLVAEVEILANMVATGEAT